MAYKLHGHGEEDLGRSAAAAHAQQQPRRKGIGTRVWLVVSESGDSHVEEVGKHAIMRRTGLPGRDLRVLDPMLSYPSTILGRERAIVINLEHIKAIVTATEVLMVNSTNPLVVQFVADLRDRARDMPHQVNACVFFTILCFWSVPLFKGLSVQKLRMQPVTFESHINFDTNDDVMMLKTTKFSMQLLLFVPSLSHGVGSTHKWGPHHVREGIK